MKFGVTRSLPVYCTYNDGASCSGIHTGRTSTFECDTMIVHNDDTECASYCDVYQNLKYLSSENTTISATNLLTRFRILTIIIDELTTERQRDGR